MGGASIGVPSSAAAIVIGLSQTVSARHRSPGGDQALRLDRRAAPQGQFFAGPSLAHVASKSRDAPS